MTAVIDAHVHLWDRGRFDYAWLDAEPDLPSVFLPADLQVDAEHGERVVFVQADVAPHQGVGEAAWVSGLADRAPWIAGIVAFAPLDAPDGESTLDALADLPLVVGVRRLLQDAPDDLLLGSALRQGLAGLARRGLPFDACVRAKQLPALRQALAHVEDLQVVLDHLGKPDLAGGADAWTTWRGDIDALADLPGTVVKLSGLPAEVPSGADVDLGPWLRAALDAFGPDRCLLGSDWPVSARDGRSRADWFALVRRELAVSPDEWARIAAGTAARVYALSAR